MKAKKISPILFMFFIFFLSGCASLSSPKERIVIKEVLIPVQKRLELPSKPHYDGSAQSAKARMEYYEAIEKLCGAKE